MAIREARSQVPEGRSMRPDEIASLSQMWARRRRGQDTLPLLVASPAVRRALQPVAQRLLAEARAASVYVVTSAQPGEGKTLVAASLGVILAETAGKKVLLIDADVRNRSINQLFGLAVSPGLGDCLRGQSTLQEAVSEVDKLHVLPAGGGDDSRRLLHSGSAKQLLTEVRKRYDLAIVDLPPLLSNDEAVALCDWSDGAIMVVRANSTGSLAVQQALETIDSRKLVGVVLNQERPPLPRWLRRWF
ncbi:MAG: CpsD/CapB family tyrosine-protein kinase [Dehalococcoidia bacterium]|jgi:capsular exopolysaccharide synthesis family protein